jgi:hypothetical protein
MVDCCGHCYEHHKITVIHWIADQRLTSELEFLFLVSHIGFNCTSEASTFLLTKLKLKVHHQRYQSNSFNVVFGTINFCIVLNFWVVLYVVCFVPFCVLFVCKCVLYYCHRVATQLQLTNTRISIISYHIPYHNTSHTIKQLELCPSIRVPLKMEMKMNLPASSIKLGTQILGLLSLLLFA